MEAFEIRVARRWRVPLFEKNASRSGYVRRFGVLPYLSPNHWTQVGKSRRAPVRHPAMNNTDYGLWLGFGVYKTVTCQSTCLATFEDFSIFHGPTVVHYSFWVLKLAMSKEKIKTSSRTYRPLDAAIHMNSPFAAPTLSTAFKPKLLNPTSGPHPTLYSLCSLSHAPKSALFACHLAAS